MSEKLTGGCLCGATRDIITAAPKFAIRCWCRDCQQVSGVSNRPQIALLRGVLQATRPRRDVFKQARPEWDAPTV